MIMGSMYCVHGILVIVASASQSLKADCLKDLQVSILLNQFVSTPDGPPDTFGRRPACLTISPLI